CARGPTRLGHRGRDRAGHRHGPQQEEPPLSRRGPLTAAHGRAERADSAYRELRRRRTHARASASRVHARARVDGQRRSSRDLPARPPTNGSGATPDHPAPTGPPALAIVPPDRRGRATLAHIVVTTLVHVSLVAWSNW